MYEGGLAGTGLTGDENHGACRVDCVVKPLSQRCEQDLSFQQHCSESIRPLARRYVRLVRFDQTKFLANDVQSLSRFYIEALDCEIVVDPQEVDEAVSRAVGVPDATISLSILRLPGRGDHGPVLELYAVEGPRPDGWDYTSGQGQIAFEVDNLDVSIGRVVAAGGSRLGEVVEWTAPSGAVARFVYLRDPEGNIIDLFIRVG